MKICYNICIQCLSLWHSINMFILSSDHGLIINKARKKIMRRRSKTNEILFINTIKVWSIRYKPARRFLNNIYRRYININNTHIIYVQFYLRNFGLFVQYQIVRLSMCVCNLNDDLNINPFKPNLADNPIDSRQTRNWNWPRAL